jgi:hypothetical protein
MKGALTVHDSASILVSIILCSFSFYLIFIISGEDLGLLKFLSYFFLIVVFWNTYYFGNKKNYIKIVKKYRNDNKLNQKWIYVTVIILSFIQPVIFLITLYIIFSPANAGN